MQVYNKFKKIICLICLVLTIGYAFYLQFTNIDMTQARLVLTYWKQYIVIFAVILVSQIVSNE